MNLITIKGGHNVFSELMPLLRHRTVLITVARESDTTLRVNVLPKRANDSDNPALTTPLSFVGTPEELDRDFARELASYVDAHRHLGSTLAEAKAAMEAAAKAAQEEATRKAEERRKSKTAQASVPPSDTASAPAVAIQPNKPGLFGSTPQTQQGALQL
jgi:PRTRC genetic system protein E